MNCKHCHGKVTKEDDRVVFGSGVVYHLSCYTAQVTDATKDLLRDYMLSQFGE
jgi:hypothetical protein